MKALVTGGNGFIGSFLVEKLLQEGFSVRCLVRKNSNLQWIKDLPVEFIYGDITQKEIFPQLLNDVNYIYHLAARREGTQDHLFSINCLGTLHLAEAALKYSSELKRFIFISSVAAIGPARGREVMTEESICRPMTDYGTAKLKAEKELKAKLPNLSLTIIRPAMVYGPRDTNNLSLFKFAKRGIFSISQPFHRYHTPIYVKDLVDGIYLASQHKQAEGKVYILCNPESYSFEDMICELSKPFSKLTSFIRTKKFSVRVSQWLQYVYFRWADKNLLIQTKALSDVDVFSWMYSPQKIERELNFKAGTSFSVGVEETVNWYYKNKLL